MCEKPPWRVRAVEFPLHPPNKTPTKSPQTIFQLKLPDCSSLYRIHINKSYATKIWVAWFSTLPPFVSLSISTEASASLVSLQGAGPAAAVGADGEDDEEGAGHNVVEQRAKVPGNDCSYGWEGGRDDDVASA